MHAFSALPYYTEKVGDDGWACVGDVAGFIDPLYSPGLDSCSYTSNYVADFVGRNLAGEDVTANVTHYNEQYPIMYRSWSETPIYPLFIVRTGYRKYKIIAREQILSVRNAASRDVVIADAMQNWARVLEEVISCYWPQWFAFTPLS